MMRHVDRCQWSIKMYKSRRNLKPAHHQTQENDKIHFQFEIDFHSLHKNTQGE